MLVLPSANARAGEAARKSAQPEGAGRPTLYHFPTSLPSQQVRLTLAEKQVAWTSEIVNTGPADQQYEPKYAELNPELEVPTFVHGDAVITGTVQIATYIDEHFEGPDLLPSDAQARAEVMRLVEFQDQFPMRELVYVRSKGMMRWFQRWSLRQRKAKLRKLASTHPQLRALYESKHEEIEAFEKALRHRVATQQLVDEVEVVLDELELTLEQRPWLAGERYTLADLSWTAVVAKLEQIGFARSISRHRRPHIADWYARVRERPSWGSMIRRLSVGQALRFYGPAVAKTFLLVWVLKWAIILGIGWLAAHLSG